MESQEELNLIIRAKTQDQNAYNILFDRYWNSIYSFLYQRTSNPNIAEELAIESFAKAFDRLDGFDEQLSFGSWLMTIARNHHIDRFRKSKQQIEKHKDIDATSHLELSSKAPSPEELMIANQNLDNILFHIKSMKKEFRTLLRMRYFEDLTLKEIETLLDEPQTTIRVKLFRAKKMLANLLDRDAN
ncbi:sigma-70 family RNA polymerase sigma factor [Flavobacteriaceae bacterium]|jgi:RNA polymerase sigma-70 factor (ECF subfamily)|nr:sigma-70 family RNA polymerase sigma factor [Flavobacteriaceae bacterium]